GLAAEVLLVVLLPLDRALADLDAYQVAVRTDGVGAAVVDRRRGPGPGVPARHLPDLDVPHSRPVLLTQADQVLVVPLRAEQVDAAGAHRRGRKPVAQPDDLPDLLG